MSQKYVYNPLTCEYDIINEGAPGVPGPRGPVGPGGPAGANGVGVPIGGTTGQVLAKASDDDFDTEWVTGGGGGSLDLAGVLANGPSAHNSYIALTGDLDSSTTDIQPGALDISFFSHGTTKSLNLQPESVSFRDTDNTVSQSLERDINAAPGTNDTIVIPQNSVGQTEYIATREWVAANYSGGGGGGGDLQSVLNAGGTALGNSREISLAPGYIQLMGDPGVGEMNPSLTTENGLLISAVTGGQVQLTNSQLTMEDLMTGGTLSLSPQGLTMTASGASPVTISPSPTAMMGGTFHLPDALGGAETIASREWVAANYGGGGGGGDLQTVLTAGNTATDMSMTLMNGMGDTSLTLGSGGISTMDVSGNSAEVQSAYLSVGNDSVMALKLRADANMGPVEVEMLDSTGSSRIMRDPSSGNGALVLPDTSYSPQVIATRDYVRQHGDTTSRPGTPEIAEMYFDTDLGHPIWYDGSQWIDATGTGV